MSLKRARSPSEGNYRESTTQIFRSSSIEDRSSRFTAVFSPIFSAESLQALPEFKGASHRMTAWRLPSNQQSLDAQAVFETGHDDDGENYGGKTLEKVLRTHNVTGAIMVARWYGGVMLGPVRFDHIRNCAGNAIAEWARESEHAAKRAKADTHRLQLIEILQERDQSIAVLRNLLAEKRQGVASSQERATPSPSKTPDYTNMSQAVLERLEQVRDKTIGWILAQLEQAEKANEESLNAPNRTPTDTLSPNKAELVCKALVGSEDPAEETNPVGNSQTGPPRPTLG